MALRDVLVRIKGEESVSDAAKKSDSALGGFADKVGGIAKAVGALVAGAALGKFFKDSIESANDAERSVAALTGALKPLGIEYKNVEQEVESTLGALQASTRFGDEEYRDALTRMVVTNKDLKGSLEVLPAVAGFAIAKQLDLGSASDLVAKAMAGQTSVLTRYGIQVSDASQVVDVFKAQFGDIAGTDGATLQARIIQLGNSWDDFKESVGRAITSGGVAGDILGGLAGVLANVQGWVENNEATFALFTDALHSVWLAGVDLFKHLFVDLGPVLSFVAKLVGGTLLVAINTASFGFREMLATVKLVGGGILQALGAVVEKGGTLLKAFGINVVKDAGGSLKEFGETLVATGRDDAARAATDYAAAMKRIVDVGRGTTVSMQQEATTRVTTNKQTVEKIESDHLKMEQARQKAAKESDALFQKVEDTLRKINLKQHADEWDAIDRNVRKVKGDLSDMLPPAEDLAREIENNKKFMEGNAKAAKDNREQIEDTVGGAVDLGRSFLDIAQAAGVLDARAASSLNSVLNMATAITKIGVDPVGGVIGIIGSLSNLIGNWASSATEKERKRVMDQLSQAIRENTDALKIGSTGATISGAQGAITNALRFADQGTSRIAFFQQLASNNVSQDDFFKLAEQFGFGDAFKTTDDVAFARALRVLQEKLKGTPLRAGDSFRQQLAALNEIGDLTGQSETDRLSAIANLASGSSGALREALFGGLAGLGTGGLLTAEGRAGAAQQLKELLAKLLPGGAGIDAAALGGLSPQDLIDAIRNLLPLLGSENIDFGTPSGGTLTSGPGGLNLGGIAPLIGTSGLTTGGAFPVGGVGGLFGSPANVTVSLTDVQFGPITLSPEGQPIEQVGDILADVVARRVASKIALQNSALGIS